MSSSMNEQWNQTMIRNQDQGADVFQFKHFLAFPEITHGFHTRRGGVSKGSFQGLNIGTNVGDHEEHVTTNRSYVLASAGGSDLVSLNQVHGTESVIYKGNEESISPLADADALMTDVKGTVLMVQSADCQPVLLYDPINSVVAGVHSGWKGSIQNILRHTIETMTHHFGTKPDTIIAGIGPSLGPCCAEFKNYRIEIPEIFRQYKDANDHFDFWQISHDQLAACGVQPVNIGISHLCTRCNQDLFFSYRRDKVTGRLANTIGIRC